MEIAKASIEGVRWNNNKQIYIHYCLQLYLTLSINYTKLMVESKHLKII